MWLTKSPRDLELVFFDLETTGGNPNNAEVIEVAAVKYVRGVETARFGSLVRPRMRIPRRVQEITGLTNEMVKDAPEPAEVMGLFLDFVGKATLVSHGVLSDFAFLEWHAEQLGRKDFNNFYLCTHLLVQHFLDEIPDKTLSGVATFFGVEFSGVHRAVADAELTAGVYWKLQEIMEKRGCRDLQTILKVQGDTKTLRRLGAGIPVEDIEGRVPSTPGVFYLFNENREVTFLSAALSLRRSLLDTVRLGSEREFNKLVVGAHEFNFDRAPHFLAALLSEKRLLRRINLPIDPRKLQRRADDFVQILIPPDLVSFAVENPGAVPFALPPQVVGLSEDVSVDSGTPEEEGETSLEEGEVRHVHRLAGVRNLAKFQIRRDGGRDQILTVGPLQEGIGWAFGPVTDPKALDAALSKVLAQLGITDGAVAPRVRLASLWSLVCALHGQPDGGRMDPKPASGGSRIWRLFADEARARLRIRSAAERAIEAEGLKPFPIEQQLRSGLAVLSNADTKATDIAVVVKGRVKRLVGLTGDEGEKLSSPRYFTRVFSDYHEALTDPCAPVFFTSDVCSDIELFRFWLRNRSEEGEWADFSSLASLYDPSLV